MKEAETVNPEWDDKAEFGEILMPEYSYSLFVLPHKKKNSSTFKPNYFSLPQPSVPSGFAENVKQN